jgi:hypothetical protein
LCAMCDRIFVLCVTRHRVTDEVTKDPHNAEKRRALEQAMKALEDNKAALLAATKGFVTTKPDQELLLAAARVLCVE